MHLVNAFRIQAAACRDLGSDLYARLLDVAAGDLEAEGPVWAVAGDWATNPVDDAVALRLMAGVHLLVLAGAAPALEPHYPTTGGAPHWPDCGRAFLDAVAAHPDTLRGLLRRPPQTNEVGRSAVLLGGLLEAGRICGLPMRLLEVGASAGLNLLPDRYRFELGIGTWGDPASPVCLRSSWSGVVPDLGRDLDIDSRRGSDPHPLRVTDPDDRMTLRSFVWADQPERVRRLDGAADLAATDPPTIDTAPAETWLAAQLATAATGRVTVVQHSVVMSYLEPLERHRVLTMIRRAGAAADTDAPLAWLRYEPGRRNYELRLAVWPQGIDLVLGEAHAHGDWVRWSADGASN